MFEDELNHAITLSKSGRKIEAREILKQIVKDNPQEDRGWLWLADTYTDNLHRISVLQECLKHNPDSLNAQKGLAKLRAEEAKKALISQQELSELQNKQGDQDWGIGRKSSELENADSKTISKKITQNNRLLIILAGVVGLVIFGSLCVFGIWMFQKQGIFTTIIRKKPITSLPSTLQIPSLTVTYSATPIVKTPTFTLIPTMTLTPSMTFTPSITYTPSLTPTVTATATSEPMSALAKQAIKVLEDKGFVITSDPDCVLSCQIYVSDVIPMEVAVHNNGQIIFKLNDESIVFFNMIKQEDCPILYGSPYNMEFECDLSIIKTIYSSASPFIDGTVAIMMDGVNNMGHYEETDSYGFYLQGVASSPHKIIITITPPK